MVSSSASATWLDRAHRKIIRSPDVLAEVILCKPNLHPVVCVKGVYDMLHTGHVMSMMVARGMGASLVVGVNRDEAVRRRKGASRPIIPEDDRLLMVASLECVDWVTVYSDDSPFELLMTLKPEVFVASHFQSLTEGERTQVSRYTRLVEVKKAGRFSTTEIIDRVAQRIKKLGRISQ